MDTSEYYKLDQVDRVHWFYRGKRAIIRFWMRRHLELSSEDLLVDAGMGSGVFLEEMSEHCRVIGLDNSDESLLLAGPRVTACGGGVIKTDLSRVGLPDNVAAVVTMLDVLEHLDDDRAALCEAARLTKPGGLVMITVPACKWLWSDWDEALHHRRRYSRTELLRLFSGVHLELLRCTYFNSAMFAPILVIRLCRRLLPHRGALRAEDFVPGKYLNAILHKIMVAPACWAWFRPPFGLSLFALLRKPLRVSEAAGLVQL
jgi:ubiquinone/menaquinone biosynthesis C-methylase UbiE